MYTKRGLEGVKVMEMTQKKGRGGQRLTWNSKYILCVCVMGVATVCGGNRKQAAGMRGGEGAMHSEGGGEAGLALLHSVERLAAVLQNYDGVPRLRGHAVWTAGLLRSAVHAHVSSLLHSLGDRLLCFGGLENPIPAL